MVLQWSSQSPDLNLTAVEKTGSMRTKGLDKLLDDVKKRKEKKASTIKFVSVRINQGVI